MWEPFTERAKAAIITAQNIALEQGYAFIDTLDFLAGFLADKECSAYGYLVESGVTKNALQEAGRSIRLPPWGNEYCQDMCFTPAAKDSIGKAFEVARSLGLKYIGTECLLLAILDLDGHPIAHQALRLLGVCPQRLSMSIKADLVKPSAGASAAATPTPEPGHPWLKLSPFGVRL